MVAPTPDFYEHSLPKILRRAHRRPGINDALIRPHDNTQRDLTFSTLLRNRAVMRGRIRTLVVMVDFQDVKFDNRQTKRHYETLWFGPRPTNSVNSYFQDVSKEKVSIYGEVKGPYTLEHDMSYYANHRSGLGNRTPNAMTMAREAVAAAEKDGVNFGLYDNDRDGFVDSFVIVHAGRGAEHTRSGDDIWSHKGVLQDLGPFRILLNAFKEQFREDQPAETNVFAYLTIPADCKLGVCVHELGHLAFGWPDLYDGDYSSSGIGNWCLMASGSYNGDENNPAEPSAWCKLKQKWVDPIPIKNNQKIELKDVKDENKVVQIWKENLFGSEYFLLEYRKQKGRDADLPGSGLLMWHIDEEQDDNRSEMTHYKVALMQGDGERDMERGENLGDPGDPFPGFNRIDFIGPDTNPSTNDWSGSPTGIIISDIRELKDSITFTISY